MKYKFLLFFSLLLIQEHIHCNSVEQQLQDAQAEQTKLEEDIKSKRSAINATEQDIQTLNQQRAQNAEDRARIEKGHTALEKQKKANEKLQAQRPRIIEETEKFRSDTLAAQRAYVEQSARAAQLNTHLERERTEEKRLQHKLEVLNAKIRELKQQKANEDRTQEILRTEYKNAYGAPALKEEQAQLNKDNKQLASENHTITERTKGLTDQNNRLVTTNRSAEYTNSILKGRLSAQYPQPSPAAAAIANAYQDGKTPMLAANQADEKIKVEAHAHLVQKQEYNASKNLAFNIQDDKKGIAERYQFPFAAALCGVLVFTGFATPK